MIQTRLKADYKEIVGELEEIMRKKNHDYGPDNIAALGVRGVYVRMWDKVARLKQLVWENQEPLVDDESVEDTLKDLANYAIISLLLLRDKWGGDWE